MKNGLDFSYRTVYREYKYEFLPLTLRSFTYFNAFTVKEIEEAI